MSVEQEFDENFKKILFLFKGEDLFKKTKAGSEDISDLVEELISEKKQEFKVQFKQDVKNLIVNKIKFDNEVKEAEKKFRETISAKKKEYNDEMKKLFGKVQNFDQMIVDYHKNLNITE